MEPLGALYSGILDIGYSPLIIIVKSFRVTVEVSRVFFPLLERTGTRFQLVSAHVNIVVVRAPLESAAEYRGSGPEASKFLSTRQRPAQPVDTSRPSASR